MGWTAREVAYLHFNSFKHVQLKTFGYGISSLRNCSNWNKRPLGLKTKRSISLALTGRQAPQVSHGRLTRVLRGKLSLVQYVVFAAGFSTAELSRVFFESIKECACKLSRFSWVRLCATPWTVARQAPLSMGFSRQNTGVGCHSLLQEIFLTRGLNLGFPHCRQMFF